MARTQAKAKDAEAAKPATTKKRTVQRTSQKLTMSQTKVFEGQFDTRLKDITTLDGRLAEIENKWPEDQRESFVPAQVAAARLKIGEALVNLGDARAEFEKIGEQYRTFFG